MSKFRDKLVKMIKGTGSKFNDYSMFKQILLHWGYELTQKGFFKWVDQEILKKRKKKMIF